MNLDEIWFGSQKLDPSTVFSEKSEMSSLICFFTHKTSLLKTSIMQF
jgi:hypothetical protein